MKQSLRGFLAATLMALLVAGCATQSPSVVDRAPDRDPGQLLRQAEEQVPEQAAMTRLEAADILARQGEREDAFETAGNIDEQALPESDRVRWALLFSELARALDDPHSVLRATQVLDDELPMPSRAQRTLEDRQRWARETLDKPDPERFALPELEGETINRIAVALPESGALSNLAEALASAMRRHHDIQGDDVQLSFLDATQYSLDELYDRVQQMNAQVMIGPLSKEQVTQLEQRDSVPVPTLALNYGSSERNQAKRLFQYGLSAEDEARQAARRAWQDGHRRMALMVPDNDWGQRVGEAFWNQWQRQGGDITNAVRYNPGNPVSDAVKTALNVRGERARLDDIDALFLLALPEYARQVPPTMDYYYAQDLPVYATSHLHDGARQIRLDQDLNDVMFMDIPWQIPDAAVGGEEVLPFYASYQRLREESDASMFRLMAMGVDAYEIATRLSDFSQLQGFDGSTGKLFLTSDGRIYRELPWAKFQNGVPSPILIPGLLGDTQGNQADNDERNGD
ncbi:penicillin-binding protein activator [Halomonas sp. CUBES01]|uniref:Penicillin-binding protein activator n=1 Tax=Vreelandella gomseomensis TaxID=370766 RepID=A0ABU1G8W5_9GAMM|nr:MULTISPECIES: penicillin-binding protein activator [Halomonas]MDR5873937.1 penicillin-binding protein activator [Halomonas gomseomensis]MEC4767013.1 penicillin-binding protein activator [Halomonas sp. CUBES01]